MRRGFVLTSLGQVHYRDAGGGDPFVLLHQSSDSSAIFLDVMPCFAERFRVVAVDTPGFGESEKPDLPPSIESYARSIADCLDALHFDRFALLGQHTGASIAVEIAVTLPERVAKLVLLGCPDYDADVRREKLAGAQEGFTYDEEGAYLREMWESTKSSHHWIGWASLDQVQLNLGSAQRWS